MLDIRTNKAPMNESGNSFFEYEKWDTKLEELAKQYRNANPYPHLVLDGFLNAAAAQKAKNDFPAVESTEWVDYRHFNTKKLGQNKRDLLPEIHLQIIEELNSDRFLTFLRKLTGIPNLIADPYLEGGGLHQILPGGFLNIHADFTSHTKEANWARRVNILIYLNENWLEEYGGHLELWDRQMKGCETKILPILNRCVIFNTDTDTYHGHPEPLTCPEGWTRKSLALYYFTSEAEKPLARSTEYRSRPGDNKFKKGLIYLDKLVLRLYDKARRHLGVDDQLVSKVLKWFR